MSDHKKELMLIKELMDKLIEEMEPTTEDFDEALGRKPEVKAVSIEAVPADEDMMPMEDEMDSDMDDMLDEDEEMMVEESPEEALKRKIEKMRG